MAVEKSELNGIIAVYKKEGWTSFDVIAKLRGVIKIKRLGHGGTLDPMATGVLPVFVGKSTKACDVMPDDEKAYKAGFKFGLTTDTQDITGIVLTNSNNKVDFSDLEKATHDFEGDIMQLPPMFSAVKVGGKKLYELARQGKVVERNARPIRVDKIEILSFDEETQSGEMEIKCSKGTYIRTILHDIGEQLGCGCIMTTLERTLSGGFELCECHTLEEIQEIVSQDKLADIVMPIKKVFEKYKKIKLNDHCSRLYKNGVKLRLEQVGLNEHEIDESLIYSVFDSDDCFVGLAKTDSETMSFKVFKNFF